MLKRPALVIFRVISSLSSASSCVAGAASFGLLCQNLSVSRSSYFLLCDSTFSLFYYFLFSPPPSPFFPLSRRKTSGPGSPDSVLKKSLLPASILYPTTSSTITSLSSSSQTDCSSFSTENHQRRKHLLTNSSRSRLNGTATSLVPTPIELISRSPDGRFILPPYNNDTLSVHNEKRCDQLAQVRRSVSLHSERESRIVPPFVLSVDLPPCNPTEDYSSHQICGVAQRLNHESPCIFDQKTSCDGFPDLVSMCSNSSMATNPNQDRGPVLKFPVLPHIRSSLGQQSTTASTLVLQMEHERERGNLSHCLKLAQEREELERELQKYTLERSSMREIRRQHSNSERRKSAGYELLWGCKSSTLPHRYRKVSKESFGLPLSPFSSSSVHWEAHSLVSPPTLAPTLSHASMSSSVGPSCFKSGNHHPEPFSSLETELQSEEAGSFSIDRLTHPHVSSKYQKHERVEALPESCDNLPQSTLSEMQTNNSCSEAQRVNNLSHGSNSALSLCGNRQTERSNSALGAGPDASKEELRFPEPTDEDVFVEMSVDEPELEVCLMQPSRPMLHHRIASHLQQGHWVAHRSRYEDMSRSARSNSPAFLGSTVRVSASPEYSQPKLVTQGSKIWDSKHRSRSLDSRRQKKTDFLTPDAWINSLSQENCSNVSSSHPDSLFWENQTSSTRKISKLSANSPSVTQAASCSSLCPRSCPERPVSNHEVPHQYMPTTESLESSVFPNAAKWPVSYCEDTKKAEGSLEEKVSRFVPPGDNDLDGLEVDAEGYEGVPESGSNYSSYASSGRGSMEPANRRLSLCHLSPILTISPETVEEIQGSTEDERHHHMELSQRYSDHTR